MRKSLSPVILSCALVTLLAGSILIVPPLQRVAARGNVGAPVKAANTTHTVSVGGHGEVSVAPDQATMTLGVETQATEAQDAVSSNATKMQAVIAAVEAQGVPASHIQTSNLSISRDTQRGAYVVSHEVTARVDNVDRVGSVLDAAVAAGANSSWGVGFGLKDPSTARSQALQAAIADARKRADAMAGALGVTISGVGSAAEASYTERPPVGIAAAAAPGAPAATPVQPGEMTVSADVSVVYTFG